LYFYHFSYFGHIGSLRKNLEVLESSPSHVIKEKRRENKFSPCFLEKAKTLFKCFFVNFFFYLFIFFYTWVVMHSLQENKSGHVV
jgi:hypothetical protein